jgi:hypothetical protein
MRKVASARTTAPPLLYYSAPGLVVPFKRLHGEDITGVANRYNNLFRGPSGQFLLNGLPIE